MKFTSNPFLIFLLIFLPQLSLSGTTVGKGQKESYKILFLGDSLTEGYGIDKDKCFPFIAAKVLKDKGINIEVINGSVSGSTTASGTSRLKWFARARPDFVFLALGANDALRGVKGAASKKNLAAVIELAKSKNIKTFLAGMMAPPNYGKEYGHSFAQMYLDLQRKYQIPTLPFLLEGVAGEKKLNQEDGIHPNIEGHKIIGQKVAHFLMTAIAS